MVNRHSLNKLNIQFESALDFKLPMNNVRGIEIYLIKVFADASKVNSYNGNFNLRLH